MRLKFKIMSLHLHQRKIMSSWHKTLLAPFTYFYCRIRIQLHRMQFTYFLYQFFTFYSFYFLHFLTYFLIFFNQWLILKVIYLRLSISIIDSNWHCTKSQFIIISFHIHFNYICQDCLTNVGLQSAMPNVKCCTFYILFPISCCFWCFLMFSFIVIRNAKPQKWQ